MEKMTFWLRPWAHRTRFWVQRADEGIAAPWVAGFEIESRKNKKIRGQLSPKIK